LEINSPYITCICGRTTDAKDRYCSNCAEALFSADSSNTSNIRRPIFYPLGLLKLSVLSLVTLGLYQFYWFYKNWKYVKLEGHQKISPVARAIFSIFYFFALLKAVKKKGEEFDCFHEFTPPSIAIFWTILVLMGRAPDPWSLLSLLSVLALLPAQRYINQLNTLATDGAAIDEKFTVWNWLLIIPGFAILVLWCIGSFMPQTQ
jgi:hypothetical protein